MRHQGRSFGNVRAAALIGDDQRATAGHGLKDGIGTAFVDARADKHVCRAIKQMHLVKRYKSDKTDTAEIRIGPLSMPQICFNLFTGEHQLVRNAIAYLHECSICDLRALAREKGRLLHAEVQHPRHDETKWTW